MDVTRRSLTAKQKAAVRERQRHLCGCGCERSLVGVRIEYDHIVELWEFPEADRARANDLENFQALVKIPCHQAKTSAKATTRGHVNRMGKKHRGEHKPKSKLRSRGFERWLGMDGTVRTRKDKSDG